MGVKFGICFVPSRPNELIELCVTSEQAGFDRIGLIDSQSIYRELWVSCALAASHTSRIKIGPRVTNPLTRHVAVTASATATLEELAPGRVFLGMGTGDSALGNLGLSPAMLSETREAITAVRAMISGRDAVYHGKSCRLGWSRYSIPIYMAAHGPKALRLAGEIADGVIIGTGLSKDVVSYSLEMIAQGAERSGRALDDLDLWWLLGCNLGENREAALVEIHTSLAAMAHVLQKQVSNSNLVPAPYADAIGTLCREYVISEHLMPDVDRKNVRLIRQLGLEEYLADRFSIVGTPDDCLRQIERAVEVGATQLWASIHFPNKLRFLERWGAEIISRFA